MSDIRIRKNQLFLLALAVGVIVTMGCSLALFGEGADQSSATGTPGVEATATPQVAVIGVIDGIEGDHVTVSGQIYVLPASAIAELEEGDKLIILVRSEAVCGGDNSGGGEEEDD